MKRRILIIANPGKSGEPNYCEGVFKDKENYALFFKSAIGGYYSDSEIRVFDKPSKVKLKSEIELLNTDKIDFSIIVFCGHGFYSTISETNILCINDTERIDSAEFKKNYSKRIVIEDNCREKLAEYLFESVQKAFNATRLFDSGGKLPNPELCKYYYNKRIENCQEQLICATSCNIGETAGDSSSLGGYYSYYLLKETQSLAETALRSLNQRSIEHQVFSFPHCHNLAVPKVQGKTANKQNPQIDKPRFYNESSFLPFAVIA